MNGKKIIGCAKIDVVSVNRERGTAEIIIRHAVIKNTKGDTVRMPSVTRHVREVQFGPRKGQHEYIGALTLDGKKKPFSEFYHLGAAAATMATSH